ncbi:MAG: hypothetical protein OEL89_03455 [Candidatus Peregrinibacteria bacterium]|nr:hypothetical protein [Candidatus Peregrinibacteria bacterium]
MGNKENIFKFIQEKQPVSPREIVANFDIKRVMVQRHLKNLQEDGVIEKRGSAPKVYYFTKREVSSEAAAKYNKKQSSINDWLYVLPDGTRLDGAFAFEKWCKDRRQDPQKMAKTYEDVLAKNKSWYKNGWVDATAKFRETFEEKVLKKVFYLDFYALEVFGKTKLGQLVFQAKLSQDLNMVREITELVEENIKNIIKKYKIEVIVLIPHSLKREIQFLPSVEKILNFGVPIIKPVKIIKDIPIAQKSLSKFSQRVENARSTIFFTLDQVPEKPFSNVLIIDDAVGSGSTLQETGKKILQKNIAKNIYGLAIVGSKKGFEVISET